MAVQSDDLSLSLAGGEVEQGESFVGFGEEEGAGVEEEDAGEAFEEGDVGMAEEGDGAGAEAGGFEEAFEVVGDLEEVAVGKEEAMAFFMRWLLFSTRFSVGTGISACGLLPSPLRCMCR